jgi:hypothetical protein
VDTGVINGIESSIDIEHCNSLSLNLNGSTLPSRNVFGFGHTEKIGHRRLLPDQVWISPCRASENPPMMCERQI